MIRGASESELPPAEVSVSPPGPAPAGAGLTLRPVEPKDAEAIHALLVAAIPDVLADRQRWLSRWVWQYWDNPYRRDRPAGWVLVDGDLIVGHLGAVYVPLRVGSGRATGVVGADYAVAEGAIARGSVFAGLQLAEAFFSAAEDCVAMATTANEKTAAVFSRFGCEPIAWTREFWRARANLTQQIRACHGASSRIARRLLSGPAGSIISGVLGRCYRRLRHQPAIPIPAGCRLETTMPQLAGDLGWLWEGFAWSGAVPNAGGPTGAGNEGGDARRVESDRAGVVGIDRAQSYLDWRYARHPERDNIRVLVVRDGDGQPTGTAVVFLDERETRRIAFVEELIALPDRMEVVRTLLCSALRLACDHEADYVVTTTGRPAIRHVFRELGFESRARSAPAVVIQPTPTSFAPGPDARHGESIAEHLDFWHGEMF